MKPEPTRILVVDDSALYRQSIRNVLREISGVDCIGSARNGREAIEKIAELDPDLLTLDVQMPDMNGIEVLREIGRRRLRPKAIVVSSLTHEGARVTTDALMEGAFDFILKPTGADSAANRGRLRDALAEKIEAFHLSRHDLTGERPVIRPRAGANDRVLEAAPAPRSLCRLVVIATSTGGPMALKSVIPKLPAELGAPVLVVQHMPANYTRSLANRLDGISQLHVLEADEGIEAVAGQVLIARGGMQMAVERRGASLRVRITDDPPEHGVRPSADYLFRSVCEAVEGDALAIVMTGMGRDALEGCRMLKNVGGYVFAQAASDCVVYGMPKAVTDAGLADRVLTLGKIAPAICRHVRRSRSRQPD